MAEISYRKRGVKWEYRFEGAKIEGKRNQISKGGFKTKKEAAEAGTKALAEYNRSGLSFEPSEISVHDYLDYWFDNYCKIELGYNTQLGYLGIIQNHLKPKFGQYKLHALNSGIIQEFANELKLKGYSKSHSKGILTTLQTALDYAVQPMQYIDSNPMHYVKYPKIERKAKERIILTLEQFSNIINKFPKGNRFYIPLLLGWNCGFRISETFGITWDDIDFENKTITIDKQIVKRNYGIDVRQVLAKKGKKEEKSSWYFASPKYNSNRTIKVSDSLLNVLKEEKVRQAENELSYGEYYKVIVKKIEKDEKGNDITRLIPIQKCIDSKLPRVNMLCISENGDLTTPDSFKYCCRVIQSQLGLDFNYHALRHTHATILNENGASPKSIQMRLGHKKIETTMQTYVRDTDKISQDAVDIFESAINKNLPTR